MSHERWSIRFENYGLTTTILVAADDAKLDRFFNSLQTWMGPVTVLDRRASTKLERDLTDVHLPAQGADALQLSDDHTAFDKVPALRRLMDRDYPALPQE